MTKAKNEWEYIPTAIETAYAIHVRRLSVRHARMNNALLNTVTNPQSVYSRACWLYSSSNGETANSAAAMSGNEDARGSNSRPNQYSAGIVSRLKNAPSARRAAIDPPKNASHD